MSFVMGVLAMLAAVQTPEAPPPPVPEAAAITPGTFAVKLPAPVNRRPPPETPFAEAVDVALAQAGFTAIPSADHARYAVTVEVTRTAKGSVMADTPTPGSGAIAGNGGVSFGLGGSNQSVGSLVSTELTVRFVRRGETEPAWEGHAVTHQVAGSRSDAPTALATKLASALFRNFPQPSGLRISVP